MHLTNKVNAIWVEGLLKRSLGGSVTGVNTTLSDRGHRERLI